VSPSTLHEKNKPRAKFKLSNLHFKLKTRTLFAGVFVLIATIVYFVISALYSSAENAIFQPQQASYRDSNKIIKLPSGEGAEISAIYLPHQEARYTILYSHGNAEDIGMIFPVLEQIRNMGFSILAYDYRGYGTSTGTPSEEGLYRDEDTAYNYLVNNLDTPPDRIIALGRSLGGAVAVDLARRQKLAGVVVESSFLSIYQTVPSLSMLPFDSIDKFKSGSKMKDIHAPVLVIHGKKDQIVPFEHGEKLFQAANAPKLSLWVDDANHNNLLEKSGKRYEQALKEFVTLIENK
jgi:fermentation-respiration switch protein FrsA (DUF1100 family)